jgi:hypothetical protein
MANVVTKRTYSRKVSGVNLGQHFEFSDFRDLPQTLQANSKTTQS